MEAPIFKKCWDGFPGKETGLGPLGSILKRVLPAAVVLIAPYPQLAVPASPGNLQER